MSERGSWKELRRGNQGHQSGRSVIPLIEEEALTVDNDTLRTLRERRSAGRFTSDPVPDDSIEAILEAGRWAPSGLNSQPWEFVVVREPEIRAEIALVLQRITLRWQGFAAAPVMIVVAVDPEKDPAHFVEDGAVAAQNLCLAAHSLGFATSWAGVYRSDSRKGSGEDALRRLLSLPRNYRAIAVIPVGFPADESQRSRPGRRRPLAEMTHLDHYEKPPLEHLADDRGVSSDWESAHATQDRRLGPHPAPRPGGG